LANQNVQAKLREGIEAARRGDKIAARRLLQQVLLADKNNEIALMWMASVADALEDRRAYLQRALQLNPNNERAREAITRLGGTPPPMPSSPGAAPRREFPSSSFAPSRSSGNTSRPNYYLIAAGGVAAAVVVVIILAVIGNLNRQAIATPTQSPVERATAVALRVPTATNTPDSRPPTETLLPGIIVTFNQNNLTQLPPAFTPTFTYTPLPSATLAPTAVPIDAYRLVYSDFDPGLGRGSLYIGDSSEARRTGLNESAFDDVAYDANTDRIAFVRPIYYAAEGDTTEFFAEELYVASLSSVDDAVKVTTQRAGRMAQPQWSADGSRILFSADTDGDEELYLINADGSGITQLTDNENVDTGARFRFDGLIVFASDAYSPGFTEIYTVGTDGAELNRLTNHSGNSYAPAYSPDGTRIAYINDQNGDGDLYVMDSSGQRPFLLTIDDNDAEDRTPIWSPDGQWIAFSSNREGDAFGWYAADLNGNIWQIIAPSSRVPQTLNFIPVEGDN